ncbi:MAG TPA: ABC transporter permease [Anaerolineaceae bacterium]|jgi:ribose/xylose/arabinose/galactoside ABC-type transport system permease subunit
MENASAGRLPLNQKKIGIFLIDHIMEVFLILIILGLTFGAHGFMTWDNWMNILRSNSLKGVIALGMTMVIIAYMIDLSIGSTVALAGVIVARFCRDLTPLGVDLNLACILGMTVSFGVAILMGWVHGTLAHRAGMPPFIATLVSKFALYGLAGIISGGYPIANQFPDWFNQIGGGRVGGQSGVPIPAIILVVSFLIVLFIMNNTTTGRAVYAAGGNPESARLSGINVGKTIIIVFIAVQVFAVISGFMTSGQVMAGSYSFGSGWELDVIAAVIIGGTSFNGGIGTVWGTLLGIVFMGVITNGMTLLNFDIYTQYVVRAVIMGVAVLVTSYRAKVKA